MERDRYGYVEFVDMKSVSILFDETPSFSELVARARDELHVPRDDDIAVEAELHLGSPLNMLRKVIPIVSQVQWEKYMRSALKSQFQSLDVVVRREVVDPIPHGFSPPMTEQAYLDPPVTEPTIDEEVAPTVLDAQSGYM